MKRLIIFLLLFAAIKVAGQTTGYLRFDTVRIYKQGGTAELYLINSTKDSLGQLTNIGGGLTRFIKPRVLNDSTFIVGLDTLVLRGATGGGGGTDNTNTGSGYRILKPSSQELKTLFSSNTILWDSSSNTDGLTPKVDTSVIATQYDLTQISGSSGDTTYTEKPITVKSGSADTLAILRGWGTKLDSDSALMVDSFSVASRPRVQKAVDSLGALISGTVSGINQLTGDVTAGPGTGSQAATIANNAVTTNKINNNAVTNAKQAQMAALTAKVNATNSTADPQDLAFATDGNVLQRSGTTLITGPVDLAKAGARTGLLPNANIATFKPYPAAAAWGTIYEKSVWTSLSDFNPQGTAALSLNSGFVRITSQTQAYTPVVRVLRNRPTGLRKWKMTFRYRVIAWAATTNWFGPQIKSLVTHSGANFGYQAFTGVSSSGGGNSFITDEAGTILVNGGAGPTKSLNDVMEGTWERNDTVLTYTIRNVTTSSATQTVSYTFPANHSTILPNVGTWSFMYNASSTGIIQLEYLKIESAELLSPNILCIGDSKTAIGFADNYAGRWPAQLQATYPDVTYSAGSAEYVTDALFKIRELGQMNPQKVIMGFIGENDLRDGVAMSTVVANMKRIDALFQAGGTEVYWLCLPEDSTAGGLSGLTALKNQVVSNFPGRVINTWDSLSTSNVLKAAYNSGDGVHLTQAGMNKIVQAIIASGLVTTSSTQLRTERRRNDGIVQSDGDSTWFTYPISPVPNNVPMFDTSYNIVGSNIWQNSAGVVRISPNQWPVSPLTNAQLAVEGPIVSYGITGGRYLYGRSNPAENFSEYVNSSTLYRGYNGTDNIFIGTVGNTRFGAGSGVTSATIPSRLQLKGAWSFTNSTPGKIGQLFNSDTTTITFNGATSIGDLTANSFSPPNIAATGTSNADTVSTVAILGPPIQGANMNITKLLSFEVVHGQSHFGGKVSLSNVPTGYGTYTLLVKNGNADSTVGQVSAASFATQSALNDTAAALRTYVTYGTYTPTLTNGGNVDASSVYGNFYYTRIGNQVTVTGVISIDPTASATGTQVDISLPIASALTNFWQLSGQAASNGGTSGATTPGGGIIVGETTADRATLVFLSGTSSSANDWTIRFTYEVL